MPNQQAKADISQVIKDLNSSLPARKLATYIENLDISAEAKSLLLDLSTLTVKFGQVIINVGRKILTFVLDLIRSFPNLAFGVLIALVLSFLIASVPLLGPPLSAVLTPLLLIFGIGKGALADLASNDIKARVNELEQSFLALSPVAQ